MSRRRCFLAATTIIVGCFVVACAGGSKSGVVKGRYPAPTTRLQGRTADDWFVTAQDADAAIFDRSVDALRGLGREGIPYLIRLCEAWRMNQDRLGRCMGAIEGKGVEDADLAYFPPYFDPEFAQTDRVQIHAIRVLLRAGPRASHCLPQLKAIQGHNTNVGKTAREAVRVIEGMPPEDARKLP